ncbi:chloride channel protein 2 [Diaphorina citri]|uniref:Chloride channel protein 2 n=1 Tax=Diaphorina citri TaxID=121845 RepID=A0A3Q0IRY0_DIACI|nr:chloride channel protein 2 [Diaphorina citri]
MCGHCLIAEDPSYEDRFLYPGIVVLLATSVSFPLGLENLAPQSIGSGIPEMKTILRGVALKEYLTFNTLVAKIIGLTATLGSGLPLGKELSSLFSNFTWTKGHFTVEEQEVLKHWTTRNTDVFVSLACFMLYTPSTGVLFSIEVTTVYFAIRNYWRGFFTAVCGATVFRLLAVWFYNEETMRAFFPTNFTMDFPFDPQELTVFALIGVVCGFGGAGYVWSHRQYVLFMRRNKKMNAFLQKNRFLYPGIVVLLATSVSFPLGLGKYMAGDLNTHDQLSSLFSNFTWTKGHFTVEEQEVLKHWTTRNTDVFVSLACFMLYTYIFSIIASTIPVPSGSFIPVFKIGAAFGRMIGEIIFLRFPDGITHGKFIAPIIPGGYATVGAAAFSGAVTHTISVSVIMFEMTGQITHIIPVMIAVLISNAVAALLQPSLYDSIILIKKLPYLPDLLPSSSGIYNVYVEDFMVRDVKYIWNNMTYRDLKNLLKENRSLRVFPLVESSENMILLGSIQRIELIKLIEKHIGRDRRLQMVAEWQKAARERFEQMEIKRREERQRRPSRFEVTPAPDLLRGNPHGVSASSDNIPRTENLDGPQFCPVFGCQPKKSILKKTNSFSLKNFSPMLTPNVTPYTTVTGAESRIRMAFEAIFHKSATLQDANPDPESGREALLSDHCGQTNTSNVRIVPPSPGPFKKVQLVSYTTGILSLKGCKVESLTLLGVFK